jgi:hypothetical protein
MTGFVSSSVVEFKGQFATTWLYVPHIEIRIEKIVIR